MHKNPSMGIIRPMLRINEFPRLADPGKILRFVQDSEETFREVEILRMTLVHFQITSVADLDKVSVITCDLRQVLESSLTSGVVEYILYSDFKLKVEVF
jgi:hypothetical protein